MGIMRTVLENYWIIPLIVCLIILYCTIKGEEL